MASSSQAQHAMGTPESLADEEYRKYNDSASRDSVEREWEIVYLKSNKQSDRQCPSDALCHISPFSVEMSKAESLNHYYTVQPAKSWAGLKKYKKFEVDDISIGAGEFVYVRPDNQGDVAGCDNGRDWWKAKILEIRAADSRHVYARVVWMYNPDDLPESKTRGRLNKPGRQDYHGTHELIACNMQDVVDVMSFAGKAPVEFLDESKDDHIVKALYWRQYYNHLTSELSSCRQYCTCGKYYNPDTIMIPCTNPECPIDWLHASCIKKKALREAFKSFGGSRWKSMIKGRKSKGRKTKNSNPWDEILDADILDNEMPPLIRIRMLVPAPSRDSPETWTQPISCLSCGQTLQ